MSSSKKTEGFKPEGVTNLLFGLICLGLTYCVWLVYRIYVFPFFIALILYLTLRKPYSFLLELTSDRKGLASTLASIGTVLVIVVPLFFLLKTLIQETLIATTYLQGWLAEGNLYKLYEKNEIIRKLFDLFDLNLNSIREKLLQRTADLGSILFKQGREVVSSVFAILFNFMISIAALFFLFREGEKIPSFLYTLLPFPKSLEETIGSRLLNVLDVMVKGTVFISFFQGLTVGIYFWLFGLSTPILYGSIAAFFSLVPLLGTMAVWLPGSVYLYVNGHIVSAFALSGLSFITYLGLENIAKPLLLDKKLSLHPLFLFLSILGGVTQFGIRGFILGPFIVIAFLIVFELIQFWGDNKSEL